jgi:hypothetical protein
VVPAHTTTMPPVSHTNTEVGMVDSPGCSNTIAGLLRSPITSHSALPNARALASHASYAFWSRQSGGRPQ